MTEVPPQLRETKQAVEQDLLSRPGVVGVGIGFKEVGGQLTDTLAIRVFVQEKRDVPDEERIPPEIDGQPTDVLQGRYEPHSASEEDEVQSQDPGTRFDVLVGGISIGPRRLAGGLATAGTLGAIVKDKRTGAPMLLSCFHVLAVDRSGAEGDPILQPARSDGGVGNRAVAGRLARFSLGGEVDAAVASVSRAVNGEILNIGAVGATGTVAIGDRVRKQGRSTGVTHGIVDTVELTVQIRYPGDIGSITLDNQINVVPDTDRNEAFGDRGDSGAVVVTGDNTIVGLYIAGDPVRGNGMVTPIASVLTALEVDIYEGSAPPPPAEDGEPRPQPPGMPAPPCAPCPPRLAPPCIPPPCLPPLCLPPPCLPPPCLPPPCLPPPCLPPRRA